jgi:hypothetical protein
MLVACRLAGLSALGAHYAGLNALPAIGPTQGFSQGIVGKAETVSDERTSVRA